MYISGSGVNNRHKILSNMVLKHFPRPVQVPKPKEDIYRGLLTISQCIEIIAGETYCVQRLHLTSIQLYAVPDPLSKGQLHL